MARHEAVLRATPGLPRVRAGRGFDFSLTQHQQKRPPFGFYILSAAI